MEYEQQQQDNQDDNFMNRIKESPRTVSAIIIVVIVAAAIYAFSGNNQNTLTEQTPEATPATPSSEEAMTSPVASPKASDVMEKKADAMKEVDKTMLAENAKKLPEARTTDSAYIEVAQKGDGLTHLARRAATRYLADHETGYSVTNEHRIYIEDYIRKHMEKGPVALGAEKTISFDLVKDAIESAQKLNERQLNNLTKYTSALR